MSRELRAILVIGASALLVAAFVYPMVSRPSDRGGPASSHVTDPYARGRAALHLRDEAVSALNSGRMAQAEALARQALGRYGPLSDADLVLAVALERQEKTEEALEVYRQGIYRPAGQRSAAADNPEYTMRYVLALQHNRRWPQAVEVYGMTRYRMAHDRWVPIPVLDLDPRRPEWARLAAVAHLALGARPPTRLFPSAEERMAHLREAVALRPDWAPAWYAYGRSLCKAGRIREGRRAYQRALTNADPALASRIQAALTEPGAGQLR